MLNNSMKSISGLKYLILLFLLTIISGCATNSVNTEDVQSETSKLEAAEKAAERLYRSKAYEDALVKYVTVINLDPLNENAYVKIGIIHDFMKSYTLAAKAYTKALQINSENITAREGLGVVLLRYGKRDDAQEVLEKLVQEHPDRWKANNSLGVIYDMKKNHIKAVSFYSKALEDNPNDTEILNNMGYSYYLAGNYETAEQYFLKSIRASNDFDKAWSNLGLLYARKNDFKKSLIAFSHFMETHEASNQVGYLCMLSGDYKNSELYFKKAIISAPYYYEAAHLNLNRLNIMKSSL